MTMLLDQQPLHSSLFASFNMKPTGTPNESWERPEGDQRSYNSPHQMPRPTDLFAPRSSDLPSSLVRGVPLTSTTNPSSTATASGMPMHEPSGSYLSSQSVDTPIWGYGSGAGNVIRTAQGSSHLPRPVSSEGAPSLDTSYGSGPGLHPRPLTASPASSTYVYGAHAHAQQQQQQHVQHPQHQQHQQIPQHHQQQHHLQHQHQHQQQHHQHQLGHQPHPHYGLDAAPGHASYDVGPGGSPLGTGMVASAPMHHSHMPYPSYPYTSVSPDPRHSHYMAYGGRDLRTQPYLNPFEVKHRRRTTKSQFQELEKTFLATPKPTAEKRKELSDKLDMPPRAVQIWFQNRRAKAKTAAKKAASASASAQAAAAASSSGLKMDKGGPSSQPMASSSSSSVGGDDYRRPSMTASLSSTSDYSVRGSSSHLASSLYSSGAAPGDFHDGDARRFSSTSESVGGGGGTLPSPTVYSQWRPANLSGMGGSSLQGFRAPSGAAQGDMYVDDPRLPGSTAGSTSSGGLGSLDRD